METSSSPQSGADPSESRLEEVTISVTPTANQSGWEFHLTSVNQGNAADSTCHLIEPPERGMTASQIDTLPQALSWITVAPSANDLVQFGNSVADHINRQLTVNRASPLGDLLATVQHSKKRPLFVIDLYREQTQGHHAIHSYPWELLRWNEQTSLRDERVLHVVRASKGRELPNDPDKRALVLCVGGNTDSTKNFEAHGLHASRLLLDLGYKVEHLRESTKQELAASLARYSYEVLYIVCHGEIRKGRSGFLNLQEMEGLSGDELIELLRIQHVGRPLALAVICACNSATSSYDDAAFALAPALLRVGLAQRAVGFTAPVLQEAAMALGIELLNQKLNNCSWEEAYFHAKAILKWGPYWPILRMFVSGAALRKYMVSGSPAAWSPPRQVPYLSDDKPAIEFAARYPQLADWLQRPEDPNLLFVTGPGERGKTRLVVQLVRYCQYLRTKRIGDGARASEKQGDGPREICWIPEVALQELRKPDSDPGVLIRNWLDARARESAPRNEGSQPLTQASDVLSASSCLLIIDGWPVDRAFPMLAWGPFWKIVVTARSLPPCASPRSLEYAMELLTTDALQTHFLLHMPSTPRASRPNYTYALVTALTRSLVGNWLILQLAKRAWIQCWYVSSESTDVVTKEIENLTSALTSRRTEQQQVATLVENALNHLPEESRRCWARLGQLRTRTRDSWLAFDLAAELEEEKCSDEKSSFEGHYVKVRKQLDTLRDWGLLGYDAASQTYRVPSVIVEGQKPRTG